MLLQHYFLLKSKNKSSFVCFPNQWVTNYNNSGKNTVGKTTQSIRAYMNKQESLDPYQEEDCKTNQEDLEVDLEQFSDEHSNKDNSHPDEKKTTIPSLLILKFLLTLLLLPTISLMVIQIATKQMYQPASKQPIHVLFQDILATTGATVSKGQ
jgi:hypothetical protein